MPSEFSYLFVVFINSEDYECFYARYRRLPRWRRGCSCCAALTASITLLFVFGVHGWLLSQLGLTYGDELGASIPQETQGRVNITAHLYMDSSMYSPKIALQEIKATILYIAWHMDSLRYIYIHNTLYRD